ncbi:MAG: hypothetical protein IJD86_06770, partial [Clostridia bacterium]|nr:hypothetical protein [Clostridia bacterium]
RGRGIGSKGLKALFNAYPDQGVLVEIESAFEEGRDREERLKRKQFYLNNGMKPLHVMMIVFGVKMELLSVRCHMKFQEYHDFYRINYSEYAAKHILPADYPEDIID